MHGTTINSFTLDSVHKMREQAHKASEPLFRLMEQIVKDRFDHAGQFCEVVDFKYPLFGGSLEIGFQWPDGLPVDWLTLTPEDLACERPGIAHRRRMIEESGRVRNAKLERELEEAQKTVTRIEALLGR